MKVFLSSTYNDLIEHRIIPAGGKAAHDENHPRMKPRTFGEWRVFYSFIRELFVDGSRPFSKDTTMKVFLSSTYTDLIEHRIIPAGGKAAHGENHPRMKPRIREWRVFYSFIRELFVDGLSQSLSTGTQS